MASATFFVCILLAAAAGVSGRKCRPTSTLPSSSPWGECVVELDSSPPPTLSWAYTAATNTVSISFTDSALSSGGWVGWGINLNATTMAGADVLIGFGQQLRLYKLSAALYAAAPPPLVPETAGFDNGVQVLSNMTLEVRNSTQFTIRATLRLPPGVEAINTIYNRGPVAGGTPAVHGEGQRNGMKTIHLATGTVTSAAAAEEAAVELLRGVHAALAAASWGIILPIGAIIGRYGSRLSAPHSSWWFNAHASTQCAAYIGGAAAWALGLRLGALSPSVIFRPHRNLGIAIFSLATFQIASALFARPHKVAAAGFGRFWRRRRFWWEISHRGTAAAILLLSIINVFKGLEILRPSPRFRSAYIAFLTLVACASIALEANYCRHLFLRNRRLWRFHHDDHNNTAAINTKQQAPSAAILPMVPQLPPPSHD